MKTKLKFAFIAILLLPDISLAADNLSVHIDATGPRVAVNPNMYGIFFEEINHAGEGGLYAEMVLNRDFEINTLPPGVWALIILAVAVAGTLGLGGIPSPSARTSKQPGCAGWR